MEIIPVIDLMGGKVVRASGGVRAHYPLLQSKLTNSCEPLQLISELLKWYPFTKIYIADLDAIENKTRNHALYKKITQHYPEVEFWLDAGIRTQQCWQQFSLYPTISLVIGSETLDESEYLLSSLMRKNNILSLDFKKGLFLGRPQLLEQVERWTDRVIVMDLDSVGKSAGPNLDRILELKKNRIHSELIAAGGVRNSHDLMRLKNHGIKQVLVASALHDGMLTKSEIEQLK